MKEIRYNIYMLIAIMLLVMCFYIADAVIETMAIELRMIILFVMSLIFVVLPFIVGGIQKIVLATSDRIKRKSGLSIIWVISVHIFISIWFLRFAVGYYYILTDSQISFTAWEEIVNSFVHTLQTFSMDEDYTYFIEEGKKIIGNLYGEATIWPMVYGIYASALNMLAPVLGGAAILDIIANFFPKSKLFFDRWFSKRPKYYFSDLNDASISLAKSIRSIKAPYSQQPVIIFTDTYIDNTEEKDSEILNEARALGAICLKDDLIYVSKKGRGDRKFFLIDEVATDNLQKLAKLSNSYNKEFLKGAEIYLFTDDNVYNQDDNDAYIQIENNIREKLKKEHGFSDDDLPILVPVQGYRNLITNLLVDIPLYEPLIGKKKNRDGTLDLTVTILGIGNIGMEMFLSTYWFGQILDCNLVINVIAKESEEEFWSKMDFINPEINHTRKENDPILQINRKGDMARPYCEVKYHNYDVKSSEFIEALQSDKNSVLNSDYYLVAIGTDEDNISVANILRQYIGQHHISLYNTKRQDDICRSVISYVVYDAGIADTLNTKKCFKYVDDRTDIYMCAVGSRRDVFSVKNIFMSSYSDNVEKVQDNYAMIQGREERAEAQKQRLKDNYSYWSSLARAMHKNYKVFSLRLFERSLIDYDDPDDEEYLASKKDALEKYKSIVIGESEEDHRELLHKLAWLEHRRWCAFLRTKGFRYTSHYDVYAHLGAKVSHKQMDLKLHPCLVECDQKGIRASMDATGKIDSSSCFKCKDTTDFDYLDDLSYDLYYKNINGYDFKYYDYPIRDFKK